MLMHLWHRIPLPSVLRRELLPIRDRKSTRLNSSHANISYAVFWLQKKIERSRMESVFCARGRRVHARPVRSVVLCIATRPCRARHGRAESSCPAALFYFFLLRRGRPTSAPLPSPPLCR